MRTTYRVFTGHVIIQNADKFAGDIVATQGHRLFAVDEHRRHRRLAVARQRNAALLDTFTYLFGYWTSIRS